MFEVVPLASWSTTRSKRLEPPPVAALSPRAMNGSPVRSGLFEGHDNSTTSSGLLL